MNQAESKPRRSIQTIDSYFSELIDPKSSNFTESWEKPIEKSWESITEDSEGKLIIPTENDNDIEAKEDIFSYISHPSHFNYKRYIVCRYVFIVIDLSAKSKADLDLQSRHKFNYHILDFINNFFSNNPTSKLGIIVSGGNNASSSTLLYPLSNGTSSNISKMKSKLDEFTENISNKKSTFSIFSALFIAINNFKIFGNNDNTAMESGTNSSREVIVITSSISTIDDYNTFLPEEKTNNSPIEILLHSLKSVDITVSFINLSSSVHIFDIISTKTNGVYKVPLNKSDANSFTTVLNSFVAPIPITTSNTDENIDNDIDSQKKSGDKLMRLIKVGFPTIIDNEPNLGFFCNCHLIYHSYSSKNIAQNDNLEIESISENNYTKQNIISYHYQCPRCAATYCDDSPLPQHCVNCNLLLLDPGLLCRLTHNVSKMESFAIVDNSQDSKYIYHQCSGCFSIFKKNETITQCNKCNSVYCTDCDQFIHKSLHNCPVCLK